MGNRDQNIEKVYACEKPVTPVTFGSSLFSVEQEVQIGVVANLTLSPSCDKLAADL
jgi:hypothetical protein